MCRSSTLVALARSYQHRRDWESTRGNKGQIAKEEGKMGEETC
jgi:hypothetical protein